MNYPDERFASPLSHAVCCQRRYTPKSVTKRREVIHSLKKTDYPKGEDSKPLAYVSKVFEIR